MLGLEHNVPCVALQKDPEKEYHWSDASRHLHAYSRHELVCVTHFRVNNQSIVVDSLFINPDLRSTYYITKNILLYMCSILMLTSIDFD